MRIIELEDHGQDFTELHIDGNVIVDAKPFQSWVWKGMEITQRQIRPGMFLKLKKPGQTYTMTLRHAVISVKVNSIAKAAAKARWKKKKL